MTLVIALKQLTEQGEAVVVGSDSRVTYGPIAYEAKKIYPIYLTHDGDEIDLAITGGAGDSSLAKYGYTLAESVLKKRCKQKDFTCLTYDKFGAAVEEIESKLISKFNALRKEGIEPSFQMILASVDPAGKASMYVFDDKGLAEPVHADPGFTLIGRGAATGGMLLTRLLGYSIEDSPNLDLGMLLALVIDLVSEVDPTVGPFVGESFRMWIAEGKVTMGPLKTEALKEYKIKVEQRKNLIRLLQKVCDQEKGKEKQIEKYLERHLSKSISPGDTNSG
jgi:20S proteasome alpha/beta subunit